jgi:hypothetical protein
MAETREITRMEIVGETPTGNALVKSTDSDGRTMFSECELRLPDESLGFHPNYYICKHEKGNEFRVLAHVQQGGPAKVTSREYRANYDSVFKRN